MWNGPSWLPYQHDWPPDINTEPTVEAENEVKKIQEILRVSVESNHQNDEILKKFSLWKGLRIECCIRRFTVNCRKSSKERIRGPLMTVEKEKHHLIKIAQQSCENEAWFQEHKLILNLQRNTNDMYECRGRIQGDYPIYIPKDSLLAEKIVQEAYIRTIHGGERFIGFQNFEV